MDREIYTFYCTSQEILSNARRQQKAFQIDSSVFNRTVS